MYKKLCFISVFICSIAAYGQNDAYQASDYDKIEKNIKVKNSPYYYPNLLKKLQSYDTLLTHEQYKHLYYGYLFQDQYTPFPEFSKEEELTGYMKRKYDKPEHKAIIKLLKEAIAENPLDLHRIDQLAYVYKVDGQEQNFRKLLTILWGLINVIESSGDGLDCKSGYHVISLDHEYMLLKVYDLEQLSRESGETCDYFEFEKDKYAVPGLYFDISKGKQIILSKF